MVEVAEGGSRNLGGSSWRRMNCMGKCAPMTSVFLAHLVRRVWIRAHSWTRGVWPGQFLLLYRAVGSSTFESRRCYIDARTSPSWEGYIQKLSSSKKQLGEQSESRGKHMIFGTKGKNSQNLGRRWLPGGTRGPRQTESLKLKIYPGCESRSYVYSLVQGRSIWLCAIRRWIRRANI